MARSTRTSKGGNGDPFVADLRSIQEAIAQLAREDAIKVAEWTFLSSAWKVLKEIRRPEARGGWPIDTKTSWNKWGFEKSKITKTRVIFDIYNDATVGEQRAARGVRPLSAKARTKNSDTYAKWVYAKGDTLQRHPIVYKVVERAILATLPTIEQNYFERLTRYLAKRPGK